MKQLILKAQTYSGNTKSRFDLSTAKIVMMAAIRFGSGIFFEEENRNQNSDLTKNLRGFDSLKN